MTHHPKEDPMFCQPTSSFVRHGLVFTTCLTCRQEYLIDRNRVCPGSIRIYHSDALGRVTIPE